MRILVSSDDGIYSPGIAALADVAQKFGEVRIVPLDVEQSSASHSITASRPSPAMNRIRRKARQKSARLKRLQNSVELP